MLPLRLCPLVTLLLVAMLTFCAAQTVPQYIISTVAGNGTSGYRGDGMAATSATLNVPYSVLVSPAGDYFIAEYSNNRVRLVNVSTGFISTIVGTGNAGSTGDTGLATAASINGPAALTQDSGGNLYVSEWSGYKVRRISASSSIITTYAGTGTFGSTGDGGAATLAKLYYPFGLVFDPSGVLYIGDWGSNRVRAVSTSGIISTIAGTTGGFSGDGGQATSAQLLSPAGLALTSGVLYIADRSNNRIRSVVLSRVLYRQLLGVEYMQV